MATNYAHASYTEVIDLQTTPDKTTIIGIHTPVGRSPYYKLKGFFTQFRKFRYKGISQIATAPAASLPIDPLGLTLQQGTTEALSPRDTFNPILFKGCHGESMNAVLNTLLDAHEYVDSAGLNHEDVATNDIVSPKGVTPSARVLDFANIIDSHYYRWLTDTTWKKYGIQQSIRIRNLFPLVWKMARNVPLVPGMSGDVWTNNTGMIDSIVSSSDGTPSSLSNQFSGALSGYAATAPIGQDPTVGVAYSTGGSPKREYVQEFTNGVTRLGWLPTTTPVQGTSTNCRITALPKLMMGVFVMPPCYNVQQFQRMVIRHEFEFKDFTSSLGAMDLNVSDVARPSSTDPDYTGYFNFIDYTDATGAKLLVEGTTLDVVNGNADVISDGVA